MALFPPPNEDAYFLSFLHGPVGNVGRKVGRRIAIGVSGENAANAFFRRATSDAACFRKAGGRTNRTNALGPSEGRSHAVGFAGAFWTGAVFFCFGGETGRIGCRYPADGPPEC
jgi:hypothetical protein